MRSTRAAEAVAELGSLGRVTVVRKWIIIAVAGALICAAIFFWPSSFDLSRVHPSIRGLQKPYRSVTADYYLDGGSVGLDITDRDGQRLQLAIPVYDGPGDTRMHHRLFIGRTYVGQTRTGATEVAFTQDTKRYLADIIDRHATPGSDRDSAILTLRGSPRDRATIYTRAVWSRVTDR